MDVPLWIWVLTVIVIGGFLVFDFYSHVRSPHEPSLKEAATWTLFYIAVALLVGAMVWLIWDSSHGMAFYTGYLTELSLSADNLFVFALIIGSFQIPREYQQKVLLIGIALALIFRLIFILLGAVVILAWSDVFYLFGIFLLVTAAKMVIDEVRQVPPTLPEDMRTIKVLRKIIPITKNYEGSKLVIHKKGSWHFTPLMIALIAIGTVDIMFALDSIPAIFGITSESYLVFTTNALALMGLRNMYFLLDGLLDRLVYLSYGLAIILGFIGVKLILHALHENKLPFINGGEGLSSVPEITTTLSLGVIIGTLLITVVASVIKNKRDAAAGAIDPYPRPSGADTVATKSISQK